ncbi:MAG: HlyD family efflux transporter periplasmic adaptor subunit [Chitinophagales bacterium]|nr:HlyD family efflux transporter periplasmic adaptor subunit [Chitinophagales bacterium]
MPEKKANIDLRSDEIQDILGRVPTLFTRYGSFFILLAISFVILVSAIVKYPDLVIGRVEISSSNPPIPLYAKVAGNIESITPDGLEVKKGDLIGVLQNSADEAELFIIEALLDSLLVHPENMDSLAFPENANLGRLQSIYYSFLTSLDNYKFFLSQDLGGTSIAHIKQQVAQLQNINLGLNAQLFNCNKELNLLLKSFNSDLELLAKGIISQREADKSEANYIQKKSNCESLQIQISNNQLRIQELKMQIFSFSSKDQEGGQSKYSEMLETANELKSEIKLWKDQFLIIAPVDGIVALNEIWSEQQYLNANQEVLSLVQRNDSLKVIAQIEAKDVAKVKLNQKVNIRLDAYYYLEYGLVQGEVKSIAPVPRNGQYQVEISLNKELYTTYNKKLQFSQGMLGSAEIMSEQRTVLSRIFDQFRYLLTKKY